MTPPDPMFDATLKVIGEQVQHHIEEEERELFPLIARSGIDLEALGAELVARREELLAGASSTIGPLGFMLDVMFHPADRPRP